MYMYVILRVVVNKTGMNIKEWTLELWPTQ